MNRTTKWLFVLAVVLVFMKSCMGQDYKKADLSQVSVLCVTWPRGSDSAAIEARAKVSERLRQLGNTVVDCWNSDVRYDVQVWFYPYSGSVVDPQQFVVQYATAPNVIVAQVLTNRSASFGTGWMFSLWPRNQWHMIYQDDRAESLDSGLKRLSKALRKSHRK